MIHNVVIVIEDGKGVLAEIEEVGLTMPRVPHLKLSCLYLVNIPRQNHQSKSPFAWSLCCLRNSHRSASFTAMQRVQRKFGTFLKRSEDQQDVGDVLHEFAATEKFLNTVR